jgi:hypothetical protein
MRVSRLAKIVFNSRTISLKAVPRVSISPKGTDRVVGCNCPDARLRIDSVNACTGRTICHANSNPTTAATNPAPMPISSVEFAAYCASSRMRSSEAISARLPR